MKNLIILFSLVLFVLFSCKRENVEPKQICDSDIFKDLPPIENKQVKLFEVCEDTWNNSIIGLQEKKIEGKFNGLGIWLFEEINIYQNILYFQTNKLGNKNLQSNSTIYVYFKDGSITRLDCTYLKRNMKYRIEAKKTIKYYRLIVGTKEYESEKLYYYIK